MNDRQNELNPLLERVSKNNVETIRIVFVDQHGVTRGKTIMASGLASAIKNGVSMTSTLLLKDTSHTTVFPVWGDDSGFGKGVMTGASDFLMIPDISSFKILPWMNSVNGANTGWVLSDICHSDGSAIEFSTRQILKNAKRALGKKGLEFNCGLEVEFCVLKIENDNLHHESTERHGIPPDTRLLSQGYQYLTENRQDELNEVMELLRVNADQLDLPLRTMESEFGPSQFEFTFAPMGALEAADSMVLFRNLVKQVCKRHGYHASFMCRPKFPNAMGNGWHLHQSVQDMKTGTNLFTPKNGRDLTPLVSNWIAGLLTHAQESCLFTTPTINGYKRYQPFALAPDRIQWGHDNRGAMLRALLKVGDNASRVENRVGEPAANPYLYIASQILSGLDGINNDLQSPAPVETPYQNEEKFLPDNLSGALQAFETGKFYRQQLGDNFVDYFSHIKSAEWKRYLNAVSEWEHREYFSLF